MLNKRVKIPFGIGLWWIWHKCYIWNIQTFLVCLSKVPYFPFPSATEKKHTHTILMALTIEIAIDFMWAENMAFVFCSLTHHVNINQIQAINVWTKKTTLAYTMSGYRVCHLKYKRIRKNATFLFSYHNSIYKRKCFWRSKNNKMCWRRPYDEREKIKKCHKNPADCVDAERLELNTHTQVSL